MTGVSVYALFVIMSNELAQSATTERGLTEFTAMVLCRTRHKWRLLGYGCFCGLGDQGRNGKRHTAKDNKLKRAGLR